MALLITSILLFSSDIMHADVRTMHSAMVSENAPFFTPGAVDGRAEAIAVDGDTVFVGGTFTQIQLAFDGEIIDHDILV